MGEGDCSAASFIRVGQTIYKRGMLTKCTGIFDRRFYLSAPNYQLNISFFKNFFILANFEICFKIIIFANK